MASKKHIPDSMYPFYIPQPSLWRVRIIVSPKVHLSKSFASNTLPSRQVKQKPIECQIVRCAYTSEGLLPIALHTGKDGRTYEFVQHPKTLELIIVKDRNGSRLEPMYTCQYGIDSPAKFSPLGQIKFEEISEIPTHQKPSSSAVSKPRADDNQTRGDRHHNNIQQQPENGGNVKTTVHVAPAIASPPQFTSPSHYYHPALPGPNLAKPAPVTHSPPNHVASPVGNNNQANGLASPAIEMGDTLVINFSDNIINSIDQRQPHRHNNLHSINSSPNLPNRGPPQIAQMNQRKSSDPVIIPDAGFAPSSSKPSLSNAQSLNYQFSLASPPYIAADASQKHSLSDRTSGGSNAGHTAIFRGDAAKIKEVEDFAPILMEQVDQLGRVPLQVGILFRSLTVEQLVSIIKKHPKLLSHQCDFGCTALHYAVISNNYEIVHILVKMNCDKTIKNSAGKTAGEIALTISNIDPGILKLLVPKT